MENPLLNDEGLIAYDQISPEHVKPAIEMRLQQAQEALEGLEKAAPEDPEHLLQAIAALSDGLERSWGAVSHLLSVANTPALRQAHEQMHAAVVAFFSRMQQSQPLYAALQTGLDRLPADDGQNRRIYEVLLRELRQGGVGLPDAARQRVSALQQELAQRSTAFANNLLDSTAAWRLLIKDPAMIEGVPERLREMMAQAARSDGQVDASAERGPWTATLDAPCLQPLLQHARNRDLRQQLHQAFSTRASSGNQDNRPLIREILLLRQELAELLGCRSYAELSLERKMASDVAAVDALLDQLAEAAQQGAERDLQAIRQLAVKDGITGRLHAWDIPYYTERLREQRLQLDEEAIRAYFPLDHVLKGLFSLLEELFAIRIVAADGQAPLWHSSVRFFHVLNEQGAVQAAFYLDCFSRPGSKRGGAWMNSIIGRARGLPGGLIIDGLRIPVAVLCMNAAAPDAQGMSLLSFREVQTLFHECGHGLQHMLTTVDSALVSGIQRVEWDAVELPSQLLEQWCFHPPTLKRISGHYQNGAALPASEMRGLLAERSFNQGMLTLRQISLARIDLRLHEGFRPDDDDSAILLQQQVSAATLPIPAEPYDHFLCGFSHLFAGGYAAGYYSYKWAEVLAADAWAAFVEAELNNRQALCTVAQRFRDSILACGGSVHPMELFIAFRSRPPQAEALIDLLGLREAHNNSPVEAIDQQA